MQAKWHQDTGYLPITTAAARADRGAGLLRGEPGHRHRGDPDDRQGRRRRIPRACASARSTRSATSSTRSWKASGPATRTPRKRSTPPCERGNELLRRFEQANQLRTTDRGARSPGARALDLTDMEKRVTFKGIWLPLLLLAPQIVGHGGVLLLPGRPGDLAIALHSRPVRPVDAMGRAGQFRISASATRSTAPRSSPPRSSRVWSRSSRWALRSISRCWPTG